MHPTAHSKGLTHTLPSLAIVITDEEYPVRPAFSLLQKLIDDFITSVPKNQWANPASIDFPAAKAYLAKYQDPKQADQIMRVQAELDETKIILVRLFAERQQAA
jgi:synaptobrevin family protein YKT6